MERPSVYEDTYFVNRNMAYEVIELLPAGNYLDGGVLGIGHRVWMQHEPQATTSCHSVSVYAENIGIVNLNRHCLSRSMSRRQRLPANQLTTIAGSDQ